LEKQHGAQTGSLQLEPPALRLCSNCNLQDHRIALAATPPPQAPIPIVPTPHLGWCALTSSGSHHAAEQPSTQVLHTSLQAMPSEQQQSRG
jgi:hypothetical protein